MEATIQSTNRAINIDINVSINVDALKAIIQHLWFMIKGSRLRVAGAWSLPRLYRQELRLARAVAAWCDRHSALVNWLMAIQVMAFALYIFMFV